MSDYLPRFKPGDSVTITVGAGGVTGGQLITTAGVVAGAGATDVAGVAGFDQIEDGAVTVHRDGIQRLVAGTGGVTNGGAVKAGASGTVVASSGDDPEEVIGRAWSTAAEGALADVALFGV